MLQIKLTGLDDYLDGGTGRIKVLMMGPPGSGKTRSASFWVKPLLADCEDGRMSVADRAIPYAAITSTADMKALLDLAETEGKRPKDQRRFETLIIDTLDAYQRIVIREYLAGAKKATMSGWQDWGHLDAEMTELVARISGIPMNVIVNLHVKDTKVGGDDDGSGGYLVKTPKLKGDLKDQIAAEFDLVGFMETGWEAKDGKRVLARYVQWEPSPDKPILKDRSGQLPRKTPVNFTEEDYLGLLRPLQAAQEKLTTGSVVAEVATSEPVEHVEVSKGGPVGSVAAEPATPSKASSVAKPATAKKAAAKHPVATAPAVVTPPPPVPAPVAEPQERAVTVAEAVATVAEVLGGKVESAVREAPMPDEEEPSTPVTAPVVEPEQAAIPEPPAEDPDTGTFTVACGQPRYAGGVVPEGLNACGQALTITTQDGRITGCTAPEGQIPDLIEIGGMKTRAFMCNACYSVHRKAAKAAKDADKK